MYVNDCILSQSFRREKKDAMKQTIVAKLYNFLDDFLIKTIDYKASQKKE
jgi:hypothetical protein